MSVNNAVSREHLLGTERDLVLLAAQVSVGQRRGPDRRVA
jgi:hypothetical protein